MFELGKTLKKYVVSTGYSIRTAAKTLNYDRGTLNSILNGKRKISGELFVQIIDLLDITEQERQDLIELYHKEIYGDDYEVFNEIKRSLNGYNDTFFYDELISFENIPVNEEKLNDKCIIDGEIMVKEAVQGVIGQPIKFCVNNNPSSNNGIADCGTIRLSDLPRINFSFLSAECYARRA